MATGADGRIGNAGFEGFAVGPLEILPLNPGVASATRRGNVFSVNLALRVLRTQDFMRPVAACAGGRNQQPVAGERKAVNGIDVKGVNVWQSVFLCQFGISLAGPAGSREIQRIDGRTGIVHGNDCVRVPVALKTGRRRRILHHHMMDAVAYVCTLRGVAGGAGHLFDRQLVREFRNVIMARLTAEPTVN